MDLMLLMFVVVILGGTIALCIWAAKVGMKNREKRFNKMYGGIVNVKYLGSYMRQRSAGFRGSVVGGFVAGPLGFIVGAFVPGDEQEKHRFAVTYNDGSVKVREVAAGTAEYNRLVSLTNWDDI